MMYLDIPAEQLQRDAMAAALRGATAVMTAGEAVSVLSNAAVDVPERDDLLDETVAADDVADTVRGAALRALARTAPDRAVAAARNVSDPGEQVALAAIATLGRLGGPADAAAVARLAGGTAVTPVVVARADFARTLLAHRFGLKNQGEPPALDLVAEPGSTADAFVSNATGVTDASAILAAVRDWAPDVSGETHVVLAIACREQLIHLVLRRELLNAQGRTGLLAAPAVLGFVVSPNPEHGNPGVALLVLSQPTAVGLALKVTRTTGEPVYSGTAEPTANSAGLGADLYAVSRPGAPACHIRGLVSETGIEVFGRSGHTAAIPPRVPERRPEGDPSKRS